jgi:hypothetical protein
MRDGRPVWLTACRAPEALPSEAGGAAQRAKRDAGTLRRAGCEPSEHHPPDGAICASEARHAVSHTGRNINKR